MQKQKINPQKGVILWAVVDKISPNRPPVASRFFYSKSAALKKQKEWQRAYEGMSPAQRAERVRLECYTLSSHPPVGGYRCFLQIEHDTRPYHEEARPPQHKYIGQRKEIDYFFYCVAQGSTRMFSITREGCQLRVRQDNSARDLFAKDQKAAAA